MAIKGIGNLEKALKEHGGDDAVISISHKLYGDQKIKCKLDCIVDEERIGFLVKTGQEIYMYKDDVKDYCVDDGIVFSDDVMDVKLQFN